VIADLASNLDNFKSLTLRREEHLTKQVNKLEGERARTQDSIKEIVQNNSKAQRMIVF
jgi:hypothetical protein